MIRRLALAATVLLSAADLTAQDAAQYRRTPGDTLRYREVTRSDVHMVATQGAARISTTHDATIALTITAADTARAWYERLDLVASRDGAEHKPDAAPALHQPFVLLFPADGKVTTVSAPVFPNELRAVADLTQQFADYFVTLPAKALRKGLTWADTSVVVDTTATDGTRSLYTRVTRRTVTGDSTIGGRTVTVIAIDVQTLVNRGGPVTGEPVRYKQTATTRITGADYFDRVAGVFAGRRRATVTTDLVEYVGANRPVSLRTTTRIESTIAPVR